MALAAALGNTQGGCAAPVAEPRREAEMMHPTRRDFIALAAASLLPYPAAAQQAPLLLARAIPSSGERIPAVGLGTAVAGFTRGSAAGKAAGQVIATLVESGGRLIDTASSYGDAESVIGDVMAVGNLRPKIFIATKLESPDADELKRSLARLRTDKLDLLQLHNVSDPNQSMAKFKDWKAHGICRYTGITSTFHGDFAAVESVLRRERPDFVQIDYSLDDRLAEARILPAAAEVRAGVLTALPFGHGRLFRSVRGKELPDWARAFAQSWAQFFLKYLLADERVTAVIPGTADPAHMADNLGAMRGALPDAATRRRMIEFAQSL